MNEYLNIKNLSEDEKEKLFSLLDDMQYKIHYCEIFPDEVSYEGEIIQTPVKNND